MTNTRHSRFPLTSQRSNERQIFDGTFGSDILPPTSHQANGNQFLDEKSIEFLGRNNVATLRVVETGRTVGEIQTNTSMSMSRALRSAETAICQGDSASSLSTSRACWVAPMRRKPWWASFACDCRCGSLCGQLSARTRWARLSS